MKVTINAGGRMVEIECGDANTAPAQVGETALQLWKETEGASPPSEGPAYGFQAERTRDAAGFAWSMGEGEQPPVRAGAQ